MKIYEALKEMIENGKTIKVPRMKTYYKIGSMDWQEGKVLLKAYSPNDKNWSIASFTEMENQFFFSDEWEVVEESNPVDQMIEAGILKRVEGEEQKADCDTPITPFYDKPITPYSVKLKGAKDETTI